MTFEEYAAMLEASLQQLRIPNQTWRTPDNAGAVVQLLKRHVRDADQVLQRPSTPETDRARGKLIVLTELARASVKRFEEHGTLA